MDQQHFRRADLYLAAWSLAFGTAFTLLFSADTGTLPSLAAKLLVILLASGGWFAGMRHAGFPRFTRSFLTNKILHIIANTVLALLILLFLAQRLYGYLN
jgi:hypothetical protein